MPIVLLISYNMADRGREQLSPAQIAAKNAPMMTGPWPTDGSKLRDVNDGDTPMEPPASWIAARAARANGHTPPRASAADSSVLLRTDAASLPTPPTSDTLHEATPTIGTLSPVQIKDGLWAAWRISMLRRDSKPNSVDGHEEKGESALLQELNAAVGERLGLTDYTDWTTREIIAFTGYATGRLTNTDEVNTLTQQEAHALLGQARELFAATEGQPALQADLTRVLLIRPGQALPAFWERTPGRMERQVTEATAHAEHVVASLPTLSERDGVAPGSFREPVVIEPDHQIPERVEDVAILTPNILRAPFLFGETRDRALELVSQAKAFLALDELPGIKTDLLRVEQEVLARQLITPHELEEAGNDQMAIINAARLEIDLTEEDVEVHDVLVRGAAIAISTQLAFLAGHRAVEYTLEEPAETDSLADNYAYQGAKLAVLARMGEVLLSESSPLQGEARQAFHDDMIFLADELSTTPEHLLRSLRIQGPSDSTTNEHLALLSGYQFPSFFTERALPEVAESSAQALVANVVAKSNQMRDLLLGLYPIERQQLAALIGVRPQELLFGGEVYDDIAIAPEAIRPTEQLLAWALRINPDIILNRGETRASLSPLDSSLYPVNRAIGMALQIVEALEQDLQTQEIEVGISGTDHTHTLTRAEAMQAIGGLLSIFELEGQRDNFGPQIRSALTHLEAQLPLHEGGLEEGSPSAADFVISALTRADQARQDESASFRETFETIAAEQHELTIPTSHPDAFRTGPAIELLRFGQQHAEAFMEYFGVNTPMEARMQLASLILTIDRDATLSRKGQVIGPQLINLLIRLSNMREDMRREIEEASDWAGYTEIEADPTLTEQDQRYATAFEDESLVLEASASRRDDLAARVADLPYDHDFEWPAEDQPQPVRLLGVDVMHDPDAGTQSHVAAFTDGTHVVLDTTRPSSDAPLEEPRYPNFASDANLSGAPALGQVFDGETGAAPDGFDVVFRGGHPIGLQRRAPVLRAEEPASLAAALLVADAPLAATSVPVLSRPAAVSRVTATDDGGWDKNHYLAPGYWDGVIPAESSHVVERQPIATGPAYTVIGEIDGREVWYSETPVTDARGTTTIQRAYNLAPRSRLAGPSTGRQQLEDAALLERFFREQAAATK